MKRPAAGSPDSSGSLMPVYPPSVTDRGREVESGMADEEAEHVTEKKRRLSGVQVKALEKNFEVENKLEPDRKLRLARELNLQPRQVAVWFQNRRARWKTKQLERDYAALKASYDSLHHTFDSLRRQNEALLHQIRDLRSKDEEEEDAVARANSEMIEAPALILGKDESDSSAILNSPNAGGAAPSDWSGGGEDAFPPPMQYVKMEEHDFFGEEGCDFFSEEQAPTLPWWT